ncbi:MAG: hypothetical protein EAZ89_06695 [Bacteroidetes bacterium]|nr:MAG: hypothetical protein EAZ89_06695 [Bacteroidota bacterium]
MAEFVADRRRLEQWAAANAVLLLVVLCICLMMRQLWPVALAGAVSFVGLFVSNQANRAPLGFWGGPPNWVTGLRTASICVLLVCPVLPRYAVGAIALAFLCLDGLDGLLARRLNKSSAFGAYFDKETDAFFVMAAGLLIRRDLIPEFWVLLPGALRYVYVVTLIFLKPPERPEKRSQTGRILAGILMGSLCVIWFLPEAFMRPVMACATGVVVFSFGRSWLDMRHKT